jgi:hypothetical protein
VAVAVSSRASCCRSYYSSSETVLSLPLSLIIFQKNMRINLKQSCSPNRALQHFLKDQHEKLNSFGDFELEKGSPWNSFHWTKHSVSEQTETPSFPLFFLPKTHSNLINGLKQCFSMSWDLQHWLRDQTQQVASFEDC